MALNVTQAEADRTLQAHSEARTVMTSGATVSGSPFVAAVMTAQQYDDAAAVVQNYNEALILAVVRVLSRTPLLLAQYAKAALPPASTNLGGMIFVTDEAGGAVPAFSDGTNWRRVTDRAIVS
jgi:hypothetical protein